MLKIRLITSAFIIALVVYVLSYSPDQIFYPLLSLFIFLVVAFTGAEFIAIRSNVMDGPAYIEQKIPRLELKHYLIGFSYAVPALLYAFLHDHKYSYLKEKTFIFIFLWLFLILFIVCIFVFKSAQDMHSASHKFLNILAGFIYISLPGLFLLKILELPSTGSRSDYIYFILFVIHMGDAGAYFIGTKIGKHKLIPSVSPKKSVEGALGGLAFSALTAVAFKYIVAFPFNVWFCIFAGIILGLAGQIGDLLESAFKRAGRFKDSGKILPGHGGLLDRIDSLMLGIPVAYLIFSLMVS